MKERRVSYLNLNFEELRIYKFSSWWPSETGTYIRSVFNNDRGISTQAERIHLWDTDGYVQDNGWEFGCVIITRILLQEKYK